MTITKIDYNQIKKKIKEIINAKDFKVIIIDSAGNVISDISLSALRDALKGTDNRTLTDLYNKVTPTPYLIDFSKSWHKELINYTELNASIVNLADEGLSPPYSGHSSKALKITLGAGEEKYLRLPPFARSDSIYILFVKFTGDATTDRVIHTLNNGWNAICVRYEDIMSNVIKFSATNGGNVYISLIILEPEIVTQEEGEDIWFTDSDEETFYLEHLYPSEALEDGCFLAQVMHHTAIPKTNETDVIESEILVTTNAIRLSYISSRLQYISGATNGGGVSYNSANFQNKIFLKKPSSHIMFVNSNKNAHALGVLKFRHPLYKVLPWGYFTLITGSTYWYRHYGVLESRHWQPEYSSSAGSFEVVEEVEVKEGFRDICHIGVKFIAYVTDGTVGGDFKVEYSPDGSTWYELGTVEITDTAYQGSAGLHISGKPETEVARLRFSLNSRDTANTIYAKIIAVFCIRKRY